DLHAARGALAAQEVPELLDLGADGADAGAIGDGEEGMRGGFRVELLPFFGQLLNARQRVTASTSARLVAEGALDDDRLQRRKVCFAGKGGHVRVLPEEC